VYVPGARIVTDQRGRLLTAALGVSGRGVLLGFPMILFALLLLTGCTSGSLVGALPAVPDPSLAANVVIVRPFSVFGSGRRPTITIDGIDTYDIGPGEHVAIPVAPGERFVGMRIWEFVTIRGSVKINAEPGRTYYFVVSPGTTITEVSEAEGRALLADTKPLGRWNSPGATGTPR
jgi:hypothetical protein